jgi:hypothetical protein
MNDHEIHHYMLQLSSKMEAEYRRIHETAILDPGTAGDEGEENWAELLRGWLPKSYTVVTKGKIVNSIGDFSPQIDILVLDSSYPPYLHSKKKYISEGVVAAFECKLSLRKGDIYKVLENSTLIKRMTVPELGTPRKELSSSILYGLLSHTHNWTSSIDDSIDIVEKHLYEADQKFVNHPREMLDLLCISDLSSWSSVKLPLTDRNEEGDLNYRTRLPKKPYPATYYACHSGITPHFGWQEQNYSPIGIFITELLLKLSDRDTSLRKIASFFGGVLTGSHSGTERIWPLSIYSEDLKKMVTFENLDEHISWGDWSPMIS